MMVNQRRFGIDNGSKELGVEGSVSMIIHELRVCV